MKKLALTLSVLLSGCAVVDISPSNENCIETNQFEIFQVLNDGALAHECTFADGCSAFNQTVFILNQRNIDYYDGMKVSTPSGKCAVRDGVYKYESKDGRMRTIPVISFEYKNEPKSEEEFLERIGELREDIYDSCLVEINKESSKNRDKNTKKCECVADTMIDRIIDMTVIDDSLQKQDMESEKFVKDFMLDMEKKCGKLPKSMKD